MMNKTVPEKIQQVVEHRDGLELRPKWRNLLPRFSFTATLDQGIRIQTAVDLLWEDDVPEF